MHPQPTVIPRTRKLRYGLVKQTKGPNISDILEEMATIFEVSIEEIVSKSKKGELVKIRRLYYYVARILTNSRQENISELINRDRSCIPHHVTLVMNWIRLKDSDFIKIWETYTSKSVIWNTYNNK